MARQNQLSWGCIVSELGAIGAGKPGWIGDPTLVISMGRDVVAFARNRTIVVSPWSGANDASSGFTIESVPIGVGDNASSQRITSLAWLMWEGWSVLVVGSSSGVLCFYSELGDLLIKQSITLGPIIQMHVRCNPSAEELSIAVKTFIVRIDALDLQSQLRRRLLESGGSRASDPARQLAQAESTKLPYQMWSIKSSGNTVCTDAAVAGILPPSLFEQQSRERYFCAIAIGSDSTLATFRLSEDRRKSLTDLLFNKVVPATVSKVYSFAKAFRGHRDFVQEARPTDVKPQEFSRASLITALKDPPRKGLSLSLSPTCSLAAVTDSLGRVLLVDVHALVVVRLWKGYRDAHCKFLEAPLDGTSGLQMHKQNRRCCVKEDFCLCLAIFAPRRAAVEIWQLRNGPRLSVIKCAESCRLLQPSGKFTTAGYNDQDSQSYSPMLVFTFDGDSGLLSLLNPFLPSA